MDNQEINKAVSGVLGECWHEYKISYVGYWCEKCNRFSEKDKNKNYAENIADAWVLFDEIHKMGWSFSVYAIDPTDKNTEWGGNLYKYESDTGEVENEIIKKFACKKCGERFERPLELARHVRLQCKT